MTDTKTIETRYGQVEVETVECDSCGDVLAKDDAREFTIGDRDGYACDYCVEDGPISFPKPSSLPPLKGVSQLPMDDLFFFIILAPLIVPFAMLEGIFEPSDDSHEDGVIDGLALAGWTFALWGGFIGLLVLFG